MIELNQIVKRYHTKNKDVLAVDHVDLNITTKSKYDFPTFQHYGQEPY